MLAIVITQTMYYVICGFLSLMVLLGIYLMSNVKKSVLGNRISALAMLFAIIITLIYKNALPMYLLYIAMVLGAIFGVIFVLKVKMIQMPQLVALLNGLGGASSAIVGILALMGLGTTNDFFSNFTSSFSIVIGMITLVGSLVAAGKLHRILPQKSIVYKGHKVYTTLSLLFAIISIFVAALFKADIKLIILILSLTIFASLFGFFFSIRVGGADMPITISLLNSFSGVAAAIAGLAISDLLLVAIGGIVGASGLLLTRIMCKAMNRHLLDILLSRSSKTDKKDKSKEELKDEKDITSKKQDEKSSDQQIYDVIKEAKKVIIVPGYGMAIAQAQHLVKKLQDYFTNNGANVKYAVHPVAGRMPGHMNVLLCEANVDYEDLYEMDDINPEFETADLTIVIGANDVLNPAARDQEGTPIYGMPILNVDKCKNILILNYDLKPGYAGVENPLYYKETGVYKMLGNALDTLGKLLEELKEEKDITSKKQDEKSSEQQIYDVIKEAKKVIIVPGYGMAIAQAQHLVKKLQDYFTNNGANVKYAVHPVAGRMPGHMNVLLCEANVDYEDLYEMDDINPEFETADLTIVIGANDVLNPAARDQEGTPIYEMPILNVDKCKNILILNYDLKPGYAGVENPLYYKETGVYKMLGNALDTLGKLLEELKDDSTK